MDDRLRRRARAHIKHGEGSINHMYLDTVGKVTVGVGNMLPNIESAKALPFVLEDSSKPASQEDIKNDFENVSEQQLGMFAQRYHNYTKLVLTEKDIYPCHPKMTDSERRGCFNSRRPLERISST